MASEACPERREQIGALLGGELDAAEAAALGEHTRICEGCRHEVEALERVAGLLQLADPESVAVAPATAPDGLAPRLVERFAAMADRARRRRRLAFGGAAAGLAIAATAAVLMLPAGSGGTPEKTISFDTGDPRVGLTASLTARPWGTQVAVAVRGIEEGTRCRVWLRDGGGDRVPAGSFVYRYGRGSDEAALTSAVPTSSVDAVEVRAGGQTFRAPVS